MNKEKSDKLTEEATAIYIAKIGNPKYSAYKDNPEMQVKLYEDCLREVIYADRVNNNDIKKRIKIKTVKATHKSVCECGNKLPYAISPYTTEAKCVCPQCGKVHYVDTAPIDWKYIAAVQNK